MLPTPSLRFALVAVAAIVAVLTVAAPPSRAQEVIVERRSVRAQSDVAQAPPSPAIVFRKRADSVVEGLLVSDDTRNAETRLEELKAGLDALDAAAKRSHGVHIAL